MAFVTFVDINPADEQQFFSALKPDSQFLYSKIKIKTALYSAKKKKSISQRSMLPQISALWAGLSTAEKDEWTDSGTLNGLNGWRSFVAEQAVRIKLGLSVPGAPPYFHNAWYGHLSIAGGASEIKIAQYHPAGYYVHKKVTGKKGLYAPVFLQENMGLPLQIGISYRCDLTPVGGVQRARMYAVVKSSYQGVDRENIVEINFTNDSNWHIASATLSTSLGYVTGYTLYIEIFGYSGDVYFDQVKAIHGAVNWARDKYCYDINVAFTNQYYQIPKHWVAVELPTGATYDSDYVDGI
jgi:hypothetical protein